MLDKDLFNSERILELVLDDTFAGELYSAMCNMKWERIVNNEDGLVECLKYGNEPWSCTWRSSGGIVAGLRDPHFDETYIDWYCYGNEGSVSTRVETELNKLGWKPLPYDDDFI